MLIVIIERRNKKGNETACQKEKNKTPATKRDKKQPNEQQTNIAVAVAVLQKPNKTYGKDVFTVAYFVCMFVCSTKYIKMYAQKLSIKDFLVLIFFLLLWSFGCLFEFVLCYLVKYSQIPI